MKRISVFVPLIILLIFCTITACNENSKQSSFEAKEVIPKTEQSKTASEDIEDLQLSKDESMIPKVTISKEYTLVDIRTENLDLDRSDEQILLVQNADEAVTELWIVDYDNIKDMYFVSYKHNLSTTQLRRYQISTEDLVGDHIPEILCFGTDADKTQTLDVFRKSAHPTGIGLYYSSISHHEIQGTIEILRKNRDQSYREGISNGKSFSIETYIQDSESEDYNDLIRSSYFFRYQTNSYVLVDTEKISGDRVDEEKLRLLYTKGINEYQAFLHGPWYKVNNEDTASINPILINFDNRQKRVTYYEEGSQEILIWSSSSKPLYNRLVIYGLNELIPDLMRRIITIAVTDLNTIQVYGAEPWRGTYSRYTTSLQKEFLEQQKSIYTPPELSGMFINTEGGSIRFSKYTFVLTENNKELKGGYAFYLKGNPILSFKIISERGILLEDRVYKYDFFEESKENKVIRTLVLFPGKMSVNGFVPTIDNYVQYQQIETIETEETQEPIQDAE